MKIEIIESIKSMHRFWSYVNPKMYTWARVRHALGTSALVQNEPHVQLQLLFSELERYFL